MKRILFLLMTAMLLTACGDIKIHEDVDDELAQDALQLMDVVTKNVNKGILYENASSNDKNVVDTYHDKYMGDFSTKKGWYDGVNEDILIISNATTIRYMKGITLESEKEDLKESESNLKKFITTGEGYELDE